MSANHPSGRKTYSGPFLAIKVRGPVDVIMQKSKRAWSFINRIDKLKPFYGDPPPLWLPDSAKTEDIIIRLLDIEPPTQGKTPTPAPDQPVLGPTLDPGSQ